MDSVLLHADNVNKHTYLHMPARTHRNYSFFSFVYCSSGFCAGEVGAAAAIAAAAATAIADVALVRSRGRQRKKQPLRTEQKARCYLKQTALLLRLLFPVTRKWP